MDVRQLGTWALRGCSLSDLFSRNVKCQVSPNFGLAIVLPQCNKKQNERRCNKSSDTNGHYGYVTYSTWLDNAC